MHPLLGKPARAIAVMGALLAIPYVSPRLRALRVTEAPWDKTETEDDAKPRAAANDSVPIGEAKLGASENEGTVANALPETAKSVEVDPSALAKEAGSVPIDDPSGHALDAFYIHLAATLRKEPGAVTRVLHYGDSLVTADLISGTMRRKMQTTFGDAGHGFILVANAWEWYFHNDVAHSASDGWTMSRITGPWNMDGFYGLGGVSFRATGTASAVFATNAKGEYGAKASRFDVYYLEEPGGGAIQLLPKGAPAETLSTNGPKKASRVHSVHVPDGAASLTIRAQGEGARLFGVALERDVPGVVYDALGANGARVKLLEKMDAGHWTEQMELRRPALIVLQYGTNETVTGFTTDYEDVLSEIVGRLKTAAPDASILICAPLDRAAKGGGGDIKSMRVVPKFVNAQKSVAEKSKVAFWNTYEAMGGDGSMAKWVHASPQLGSWDLTHPTPEGAEVIGGMLYTALVAGYKAYAATHADAPKVE